MDHQGRLRHLADPVSFRLRSLLFFGVDTLPLQSAVFR